MGICYHKSIEDQSKIDLLEIQDLNIRRDHDLKTHLDNSIDINRDN
jgi:hypothetical protein